MKKIIVILSSIILTSTARAQSAICPALQSFTGEWLYVNGQDTIRIYLRLNDYTISSGGVTTIAKLWGWHEFKQGNSIVESNYSNRFIILPTHTNNAVASSSSISLQMPECDLTKNKLIGFITDLSQCNEIKIVSIIFNSAKNQLKWKQRDREGFGYPSGCKGMTLPREFILIKQ